MVSLKCDVMSVGLFTMSDLMLFFSSPEHKLLIVSFRDRPSFGETMGYLKLLEGLVKAW